MSTEEAQPTGTQYCPDCGNAYSRRAMACPKCGAPSEFANQTSKKSDKGRTAYVLMAVFLGCYGIHNFYAGYTGKGVAQLLITLLSVFFLSPITWIWSVVEACVVTEDAQGRRFR